MTTFLFVMASVALLTALVGLVAGSIPRMAGRPQDRRAPWCPDIRGEWINACRSQMVMVPHVERR